MEARKRKENTEYGIKYQISVPLDIFLLLCLDKVCCSVG